MPWPTPRTGAEELAAGVGPGSDGWSGASLVDGKPDGLAIDLQGRAGMLIAEGAVRPPLIVEPEERLQLGVGLDLGAVALQVGLLGFHGAPETLDEDVVQGAAPAIHRELHPPGQQRLRELGRGELAPLVGVEDLRDRKGVRPWFATAENPFGSDRRKGPPLPTRTW